jgi:transcriptional regulator with XRE-family HTH domain
VSVPRPNPPRTIHSERALAERIAHEREQRGWSYDGLAKRLTAAGCPIQASAVYKTEKGDPPRRVTVDELVAYSEVFNIPVEQLLLPMAVIRDRELTALVGELDAITKQALDLGQRFAAVFTRIATHAAAEEVFYRFAQANDYSDSDPIDALTWRWMGSISIPMIKATTEPIPEPQPAPAPTKRRARRPRKEPGNTRKRPPGLRQQSPEA